MSHGATVEEVLGNFDALMGNVNFSRELHLLGVGRLSFVRRRQMLLELHGVYAGLWFLALRRSFPAHAEEIFASYLERHSRRHKGKKAEQLRERASQYKEMLESLGDQDFTVVSRHVLSFYPRDEETLKAMSLRLALYFRATYIFLFERLF